ncbi:NAD-binding protein [Caldibacillus thermoamylovorans]|uniref:Trk system potassium uptake protein TrkA n=1 Tax=Caldibacillus thermoamylovorans TaxID=35841 RepID=A0ABD4AA40_9BACI|nr:NAD-binding protein [Caldibacillus thermoamylovorans]KIO68078.1 hypothetical protein B4166_2323 [Caldibacillus thermoamylovorans]KIO74051.1 hypothetical protein B4167_1596 [Caldibacillus thermoamylovorans]
MNVIIIGGGQVGSYVGKLLEENGIQIKIIEIREHLIDKLIEDFSSELVICGSGTDPNTLEEAGIKSADVLVAVTGRDEVNLVASTIAKFEFGVRRVVARVNHPRNEWLYTHSMGVDVAINQSNIMAHMVVDEMDMENLSTLMKLNRGNYSIAKVAVHEGSSAVAKPIKDLGIPPKCVLIAILRDEEVIIPRGETFIEPHDSILLLTDADAEKEINRIFAVS